MARFGRGRRRDPLVLPFLSHQVLEYLAALYLFQAGSQVDGRAETVAYVLGGLMLAAAAFSGRPLGGGRLPRSAHRWIDIVLIVAIAAAPFVFDFTATTSALVRFEGLAVLLALLVKATNYTYPQVSTTRQIARGLKDNAPRLAGRMVGRRMARRRPPGGP